MKIGRMKMEDYDEVFRLWSGTAGMGMRSLDDSFEGIRKFLKRNPKTSFVAREREKVIGVILCGHDVRRGYIYHTAVSQDYRGMGVGRALVRAALAALRREGINKAALVAFQTNESGNRFWESVGFEKREDLFYRNLSLNEKNQ